MKTVTIERRPSKDELCKHWSEFFDLRESVDGKYHSPRQAKASQWYQKNQPNSDQLADRLYEILVGVGYLIPPPPSLPTEDGAREYEEAMAAMEIMGSS